jgi:hypothetical protein
VTEHTCVNTQTTYDGSVPPPCKACMAAPLRLHDPLRADLTHLLSKWAGVEHSGTAADGTSVARQLLADIRCILAAHPAPSATMLPPPARVPSEAHDTEPSPPPSARRELPTLPDGVE